MRSGQRTFRPNNTEDRRTCLHFILFSLTFFTINVKLFNEVRIWTLDAGCAIDVHSGEDFPCCGRVPTWI